MKLAAILLLLFIIIAPFRSYGQPSVFTIRMKGVTLLKVFDEIENQSEYKFIYNKTIVNENLPVDINIKKASIKTVLNSLFANTNLDYKIVENEIVVSKKAEVRQQTGTKIKGSITDEKGQPVAGVSVTIEGTAHRVVSDNEGMYCIEAKPDNILVFSLIGYLKQAVRVSDKKVINVELSLKSQELDDVTVVAFARQKKESVIGAVATVIPASLRVSSSNLTTAFAGRVPGLISFQRSGEPGQDDAQFFIRGVTTFGYKKDPLILIDNNEVTSRELARVQPDDIASFSILKDAAATALYGSRGANGVILITTREGVPGKVQIRVRAENSISQPTQIVKLADPVTYMRLHNEAVLTRDPLGAIPYSQNKIENTILRRNPYVYPANDWYKILFKNMAVNRRVNFNVSGGSKNIRYYFSGSYSKDNGMLNVDKVNNLSTNIDLNKYLFRTNVNIGLTKSTDVVFRMQGAYDDYCGPINGGADLFYKVMRTSPVLFPPYYDLNSAGFYSQHILYGNYGDGHYNNPYADMTKGYKNYTASQILLQYELKQKLNFITPDLSLRALLSINRYAYFDASRYYNPFFYKVSQYDKTTNQYTLEEINEGSGSDYPDYRQGYKDSNSATYFESALTWSHTFNEKNAFTGLLVYTMREQLYANAGDLQKSLPYRNIGLAGRATYAYNSRYFAELNFGYNGSERFSKKERFGFFPSAGLGWFISNEDFWNESLKKVVNKLKLKATYGLVGNDAIGDENDRFFYLSKVNMNDAASGAGFGRFGDNYINGISISRYPNTDITWETARKLNFGIELGLWNDLEIQSDFFHEYRYNILMDRASIPPTMGLQSVIRANTGEASSKGVDISLDYKHALGHDFWISGLANFTYATSQFIRYEEPDYAGAAWKSHIGHSLSQKWGYVAERLFIDEYEVENSPKQFGKYGAGDIKYKDINGDGKISELDQYPLGRPTNPEIVYGFGFSGGWKGFDLSCFFQGLARESFWIDTDITSPFIDGQNALLKAYADDHWSEENCNIYALWPRLSTKQIENNMQTSSWFMRNGSFIRLKSLELGYSFSSGAVSKAGLNNLRLYFSGLNLLTFSDFKLWDPEMGGNGLGYPVSKVYNIGVQLSL